MAKKSYSAGSKFLFTQNYGSSESPFAGTNAVKTSVPQVERPVESIDTKQPGLPDLGPKIEIFRSDSTDKLSEKREALRTLRNKIREFVTAQSRNKNAAPGAVTQTALFQQMLTSASLQLDASGDNNTNLANALVGCNIYSNAAVVGVPILAYVDYVAADKVVYVSLLMAEAGKTISFTEAQYELRGTDERGIPVLKFLGVQQNPDIVDFFYVGENDQPHVFEHMKVGFSPAKDLREANLDLQRAFNNTLKAETTSQFLETFAELLLEASNHDVWTAYQRVYKQVVKDDLFEIIFFGKHRKDNGAVVITPKTLAQQATLRALNGIYHAAGKAEQTINQLIGKATTEEATHTVVKTVRFVPKEVETSAPAEVETPAVVPTTVPTVKAQEIDAPVAPVAKTTRSGKATIPAKKKQVPEVETSDVGVDSTALAARLAELSTLNTTQKGGKKNKK